MKKIIFVLLNLAFFCSISIASTREEVEVKLLLSQGDVSSYWKTLSAVFDPTFNGYELRKSEEEFIDTYFDTPDLRLYHQKSSLRKRFRSFGEESDLSDKTLVQFKSRTDLSDQRQWQEKKYLLKEGYRVYPEDRYNCLTCLLVNFREGK